MYGPNQPNLPKVSRKAKPAITGDTEKGISAKVAINVLPGKSNFDTANAAATPNIALTNIAMTITRMVNPKDFITYTVLIDCT